MRYTQIRSIKEVPQQPTGLAATTWEQRKKMTATELIEAMGALHVSHPAYVARPRTFLPMPNLAGQQPVFTCSDPTFWSLVKSFIHWGLK